MFRSGMVDIVRRGIRGAAGEHIIVKAADDVELLSGGSDQAYAQIGNGGYDADANVTDDTGNVANITVTAGTDGTGSVKMAGSNVAGDIKSHDYAYIQIGNGGALASGDHGGFVSVSAADDVTFNVGGDFRNSVQIGHGGSDSDGYGVGVGHSGKITVVATGGSLELISNPLAPIDYFGVSG